MVEIGIETARETPAANDEPRAKKDVGSLRLGEMINLLYRRGGVEGEGKAGLTGLRFHLHRHCTRPTRDGDMDLGLDPGKGLAEVARAGVMMAEKILAAAAMLGAGMTTYR